MIYYIRTLKTGERYITSYKDQAMAKRIAGMEKTSSDKSMWDGEMFFDLKTGAFGQQASGAGLASHIKGKADSSQGGRYGVFSLVDGKPNDLGLRFTQYGDANKFVRAIVPAYGELFVVEVEKQGSGVDPEGLSDEIELNESAPF